MLRHTRSLLKIAEDRAQTRWIGGRTRTNETPMCTNEAQISKNSFHLLASSWKFHVPSSIHSNSFLKGCINKIIVCTKSLCAQKSISRIQMIDINFNPLPLPWVQKTLWAKVPLIVKVENPFTCFTREAPQSVLFRPTRTLKKFWLKNIILTYSNFTLKL